MVEQLLFCHKNISVAGATLFNLLGFKMNFNMEEFRNALLDNKDEKYAQFLVKLGVNTQYEIIGVKMNILRKIVKTVPKVAYIDFLENCLDHYYEEVLIQGLIISSLNDEKTFEKYFNNYLAKIDNWAICDSFCNSIKIVRKYPEKYFEKALNLTRSNSTFICRVGLIMILCHFIVEGNLDNIFEVLGENITNSYYINMAKAWLISECYIKFPKDTISYIKENKLDKFTHNKAISKICDSFRVSIEDKNYLKTLKK